MPWCPKCGMKYIEGIAICSDCNLPLKYHLPAKENNSLNLANLVVLIPLENDIEGTVMQSILAEEGIKSVIRDYTVIPYPGLQYHKNLWGVLLVLDSDYDNAKFIISEYFNSLNSGLNELDIDDDNFHSDENK